MTRRKLCLLVAVFALVSAPTVGATGRGEVLVMPALQVTNPSPGDVVLAWQHLSGPWAIVWQDGYDTVWPNTGSHEITNVAAGPHRYKVCVSSDPSNVCTPQVTFVVQ